MIDEIFKRLNQKRHFSFHSCNICDYRCSYHITNGNLYYDGGCDCVTYSNYFQPRTREDIQELLEMNPKVDFLQEKYWI